jgi:lycopene cyclase CruP
MVSVNSRQTEQRLSHLPQTLQGLRAVDQRWRHYCQGQIPIPQVVTVEKTPAPAPNWDVVVCGATLGILVGATLAQRGWRVAVLDKGSLRGRDQEWNLSRQEFSELVELGLLTESEFEAAIATEYNPARIQFAENDPVWGARCPQYWG